jgi:hypothetical protein
MRRPLTHVATKFAAFVLLCAAALAANAADEPVIVDTGFVEQAAAR